MRNSGQLTFSFVCFSVSKSFFISSASM
jgi:hypothetical protein